MASILFLAPDDLGETVLATGALAHLLQPGDEFTLVAGSDAVPLFRAAPGLAKTLQVERGSGPGMLWRTWLTLNETRFDAVMDGRGGVLGGLVRARRRITLTPPPVVRHLCEDWADAVGAERALAPRLWLDDAARAAAAAMTPNPGAPLLVLAPGGVVSSKRWPWERFAAVARRLAGGPLAGAEIVVMSAAPRDAEISSAVVRSLDADGVAARNAGVGADLLAAAALTEGATLCIGNDNALTHLAAAMGAPTLTLFGPTDERIRAPFGPRVRTVRALGLEAVAVMAEGERRAAMDAIGIDVVEAAALDVLHAGGLR